jgi:hypothetical protein
VGQLTVTWVKPGPTRDQTGIKPRGQTRVKPGQTRVKPGQTRVKPGQTRVKPGQTRVKPGQTRVKPGQTSGPGLIPFGRGEGPSGLTLVRPSGWLKTLKVQPVYACHKPV